MDKDILDVMLAHQRAFQVSTGKLASGDLAANTARIILGIHSEASELLRCVPWRPHRRSDEELILSNIHDEIIDLFKYWLILADMWGLDSKLITEEFFRKSRVVEQRWQQEFLSFSDNKPIFGVDLDGVLCDLDSTWKLFLEQQDVSFDPDVISTDMAQCLASEVNNYGELKHLFRESGAKMDAVPYDGAGEFIRSLRKIGRVAIVTARPYHKYKRLFADTIDWCNKNDIVFDTVIFEENKREWAMANSSILSFFIEDSVDQATSLASRGAKVLLIDRPHNRIQGLPDSIRRVKGFSEILSILEVSENLAEVRS